MVWQRSSRLTDLEVLVRKYTLEITKIKTSWNQDTKKDKKIRITRDVVFNKEDRMSKAVTNSGNSPQTIEKIPTLTLSPETNKLKQVMKMSQMIENGTTQESRDPLPITDDVGTWGYFAIALAAMSTLIP
uniref:Uncharacterized protein n=1 Tax=Kwoniella pini CBS 10737 TaxID=1296096 RepID=A0A1B9HXZ5_9TREE|nr:uncharacterized protein I206_05998 [Kwoniella pini CBS 10737]OCF48130.1 hypothetical protein I206_05998 [Kwoniella pini CBS 10737]